MGNASKEEQRTYLNQMEGILKKDKKYKCDFNKWMYNYVARLKKQLYPQTKAPKKTITPKDNVLTYKYSSEVVSLPLTINGLYQVEQQPSWIEIIDDGRKDSLFFRVKDNYWAHQRADTLIIFHTASKVKSKYVLVQTAAPAFFNVTPKVGIPTEGGQGTVYIETNDTLPWKIDNSANWIKTTQTEDGLLTDCSPSESKRSSELIIKWPNGKEKTVRIAQISDEIQLYIPEKNINISKHGGSDIIAVNCNYDQWTATASCNWLSVKRNYGGLKIACDTNTIAEKRRAVIHIEVHGDQGKMLRDSIVINQEAPEPYIRTDYTQYVYDTEVAEDTIQIRTNVKSWKSSITSPNTDWLRITSKRQSDIIVHVNKNRTFDKREAAITCEEEGGKKTTFRIIQKGIPEFYRDKDWYIGWFTIDFQGLTTVGNNISCLSIRWKPAELSLVNFNFDYISEGHVSINWEPIIRGYFPVPPTSSSIADVYPYAGIGAHVSIWRGTTTAVIELGVQVKWKKWKDGNNYSRFFFKYNGGCAFGMSIDIGQWHKLSTLIAKKKSER